MTLPPFSADYREARSAQASRRIRAAAWVLLFAGALLQAWSDRHEMGPDGISYLDLSDAIAEHGGRWSAIVSGYWSPLYPLLIGVARLTVRGTSFGTPYWEFAIVHVVNVVSFIAALACFEWFRGTLAERARTWGGGTHPFASPAGVAVCYATFGITTLTMITTRATTPDLLVAATTFATFAALVRLLARPSDHVAALLLGASLGVGSLAKSFVVPLSIAIFCLTTFALARRREARRPLVFGVGAWLIFVVPWTAMVSRAVGHPTFGETGRLAYAWYVNNEQPPNTGVLPAAAAPPLAVNLPKGGLAATGDSPGTSPLWLDPVRWHRDLRPRIDLAQQWDRLAWSARYYVVILAPLLLLLSVAVATTSPADLALTWRRSWPLLAIVIAAFAAYALVYSVARYLAPFVVVGALAIGAALPWTTRVRSSGLTIALAGAPVLLWWIASSRRSVLACSAVAVAIACALHLYARREVVRTVLTAAAGFGTAWMLRQQPISWIPFAALGAGVLAALAPLRANEAAAALAASRHLGRTLVAGVLLAMAPGLARELASSVRGARDSSHQAWQMSELLSRQGIAAGTSVAVVGSPFDVAWARVGRLHVRAVVAEPAAPAFWQLSVEQRDTIIAYFGARGVRALIAPRPPATLPPGWVRLGHSAYFALGDGGSPQARASLRMSPSRTATAR